MGGGKCIGEVGCVTADCMDPTQGKEAWGRKDGYWGTGLGVGEI